MKFCSNCDNMLYLKITEGNEGESCQLNYKCNHCNTVEENAHETDSCVFGVNFNIDNIKKNAFINKYVYEDVTIQEQKVLNVPIKSVQNKNQRLFIFSMTKKI